MPSYKYFDKNMLPPNIEKKTHQQEKKTVKFLTQTFLLLLDSRNHYVEYLCFLIRDNKLETIPILSADDLETCVRRANKKMPPRPYGILEGIYRQYLLEVGFCVISH